MLEPSKTIEMVIFGASEDSELQARFMKHLTFIHQLEHVIVWQRSEIRPGMNMEQEIEKHVNAAQIIVLLISPDFLASEICMRVRNRALERRGEENIEVIPVLFRPVFFEDDPLSEFSAQPENGKPITSWEQIDEAFREVAAALRQNVRELLADLSQQWVKTGDQYRYDENYRKALKAYEEALRLSVQPSSVDQLAFTVARKLSPPTLTETTSDEYYKVIQQRHLDLCSLISAARITRSLSSSRKIGPETIDQVMVDMMWLYDSIVNFYRLNDVQTRNLEEQIGEELYRAKQHLRNAQDMDPENTGNKAGVAAWLGGGAIGGALTPILYAGEMSVIEGIVLGTLGGLFYGSVLLALPAVPIGMWIAGSRKKRRILRTLERGAFRQLSLSTSRRESIISIFAFGKALRQCCEEIKEIKAQVNFWQSFHQIAENGRERINEISDFWLAHNLEEEKALVNRLVTHLL